MAWLQSGRLCGRGKERASSTRSLKFLSGTVCEEGRKGLKITRATKGRKLQWRERMVKMSDTCATEPPVGTIQGEGQSSQIVPVQTHL